MSKWWLGMAIGMGLVYGGPIIAYGVAWWFNWPVI